VIEVKARGNLLLVGGEALSYDEARELVQRIWEIVPVELDEHGTPMCPKCGTPATEDSEDFWVCSVIECDGYHQTVVPGKAQAGKPRTRPAPSRGLTASHDAPPAGPSMMAQTQSTIPSSGVTMSRTVVVKGHVVGDTTVELEEAVPGASSEVEVVLRIPHEQTGRADRLGEVLRSLPPGTRSKDDIDRQIDEDRATWDR
jgi:hypothetical protein